jgi:neurotrimin
MFNIVNCDGSFSVSHENHRTWHLHLNDVQEADRGRYLCQINTAQAKTQFAYLNIVGKIHYLCIICLVLFGR